MKATGFLVRCQEKLQLPRKGQLRTEGSSAGWLLGLRAAHGVFESCVTSSDSSGMKVLCGHWGCAELLLHVESQGGETLAKEVCQAGSSGDVQKKCFCLIPTVWVNSGTQPAASEHHPGCQLHAWAELPWLLWRDERLLINIIILLGVLWFESFQPW